MELADLGPGQRSHPYPGEAQVLAEHRHIRLVTALPVERLGDQNLEQARRASASDAWMPGRRILLSP